MTKEKNQPVPVKVMLNNRQYNRQVAHSNDSHR